MNPSVTPLPLADQLATKGQPLTRLLHAFLTLVALFFILAGISWFRHGKYPDFACLYAQARLAREYPPFQFYDPEIQGKVQKQLFGENLYGGHVMPFVHPPFVMALLFPLGLLSYDQARMVWTAVNLTLVLWLPWLFFRLSPRVLGKAQLTVYLAALAFYPFLVCLWQGQVSLVLLCLVTGAYLKLKEGKEFQAGFLLGLAFLKFHLVYILAGLLLLKRRVKGLLGLAGSLGFLTLASALWLGPVGIQSYVSLLKSMSQSDRYVVLLPERMQNWIGQFYLLGFSEVYNARTAFGLGLLASVVAAILWRKPWNRTDPRFGLRFAATLLLCLLASPYLLIHDLSLLYLALMLCLEFLLASRQWSWQSRTLWALLVISPPTWFATLLVAQSVPVQVSVIWMSLALLLLLQMLSNTVESETRRIAEPQAERLT
jgi:hypothetical protein